MSYVPQSVQLMIEIFIIKSLDFIKVVPIIFTVTFTIILY